MKSDEDKLALDPAWFHFWVKLMFHSPELSHSLRLINQMTLTKSLRNTVTYPSIAITATALRVPSPITAVEWSLCLSTGNLHKTLASLNPLKVSVLPPNQNELRRKMSDSGNCVSFCLCWEKACLLHRVHWKEELKHSSTAYYWPGMCTTML